MTFCEQSNNLVTIIDILQFYVIEDSFQVWS